MVDWCSSLIIRDSRGVQGKGPLGCLSLLPYIRALPGKDIDMASKSKVLDSTVGGISLVAACKAPPKAQKGRRMPPVVEAFFSAVLSQPAGECFLAPDTEEGFKNEEELKRVFGVWRARARAFGERDEAYKGLRVGLYPIGDKDYPKGAVSVTHTES
jgi:hypothetical protein